MKQVLHSSLLCFFWFLPLSDADATSALEMSSFCQQVDEATINPDGTVLIPASTTAYQCWGAFLAVQGMTRIQFPGDSYPALQICAPAESTLMQFVKIFRKHVADHPETNHEDFQLIAWRALAEVFPCD